MLYKEQYKKIASLFLGMIAITQEELYGKLTRKITATKMYFLVEVNSYHNKYVVQWRIQRGFKVFFFFNSPLPRPYQAASYIQLLNTHFDYRDHTCFFHALTFAGSRGSCLNTRPLGRVFKHRPRDPASVNAMKQTCVIVILAYFT